jgi:hypothetical protein
LLLKLRASASLLPVAAVLVPDCLPLVLSLFPFSLVPVVVAAAIVTVILLVLVAVAIVGVVIVTAMLCYHCLLH